MREGNPIQDEPEDRRAGITRRSLMLAFLAALLVRGAAAWFLGSAQPQEIRYITIAQGLLEGRGFTGLDERFPDIIQPPLFPFLLVGALALPVSDLAAARAVSILMGALLVFPVAALTVRLFGDRAARRAAWLTAAYPLLGQISAAAITESTFALLVALGALQLRRCLEGPAIPPAGAGSTRFALPGLLLGLAYLTRPEGLTYLGVAVLIGLLPPWRPSWRALAARTTAMLGAFLMVAVPYVLWVHARTGQWLLAPKAVLAQVHSHLVEVGLREGWKEEEGSLLFGERVKFGLNAEATAMRSHEFFGKVKLGIAEGLLVSHEEGLTLSRPAALLRRVAGGFGDLYLEEIKHGFVLPLVMLLVGGVGLFSCPWVGPLRKEAIFVAAFFAGSFSFVLAPVQERFLYAALVFALPWLGEGWRRCERWATDSFLRKQAGWLERRAISGTVALGVLVLTLTHLVPPVRYASRLWDEHRAMGLSLRGKLAPADRVMAATPVISYYAGVGFDVLPYEDLPRVVRYARLRKVDYLAAVRLEVQTLRPQLQVLLSPERPHPGLELVTTLRERTSDAVFLYRVLPEPGSD